MIKITKTVDGILVTPNEFNKAIKYLIRHRREYKNQDELERAFDFIIRKIRGGVVNEKAYND